MILLKRLLELPDTWQYMARYVYLVAGVNTSFVLMNEEDNNSRSLLPRLWKNLPAILRAVITGVLVSAAGTLPWALLVFLNIKYSPSVPWSVAVTAVYLWFFWKYFGGAGWPRSTSLIRKRNMRATQLSSEVWGAAIMAGILGLVSLVVFSNLLNRLVRLPQQDASGVEHVPLLSLFLMVLASSAVAGISEEAGFRGYMQKPIEERHGPVIAILITGVMFGLAHFSHHETTLGLMPFYFFVALIYGMLAYLTNSILPGIILHAMGDVFGGLQLFMQDQSEWQTPKQPQPLIWEAGADGSFWLTLAGFIIIGGITTAAYFYLYRVVKSGSFAKENEEG